MTIGFDQPLYVLRMDQRESFQTKMFGWKCKLSAAQIVEIGIAKQVIYDGFQAAVAGGVSKKHAALLVDEQFGAGILRDAARQGYMTACPAEKSRQYKFTFDYGENFASHVDAFNPTFCKVLVRYDPEGDKALNGRQAARLKRLSDYLHGRGRRFIVELGVYAEPAQMAQFHGPKMAYDPDLRSRLTVQTLHELQDAGVEPDVWTVKGIHRRDDCLNLVAAARRDGREHVSCVVLGRGGDQQRVHAWLTMAASVRGIIGFAVGRAIFWDPLVAWRANQNTREAAVAEIGRRYQECVTIFEKGTLFPTEPVLANREAPRRWENEGGHL